MRHEKIVPLNGKDAGGIYKFQANCGGLAWSVCGGGGEGRGLSSAVWDSPLREAGIAEISSGMGCRAVVMLYYRPLLFLV